MGGLWLSYYYCRLYSTTLKLRIDAVMLSVISLPSGSVVVATVSGQDSRRRRTLGLTKGTQHQNTTVHTNGKVDSWVTKYKQQTFQSYVLPHTILITCSSSDIFFSWLDNTAGSGPLCFGAF